MSGLPDGFAVSETIDRLCSALKVCALPIDGKINWHLVRHYAQIVLTKAECEIEQEEK